MNRALPPGDRGHRRGAPGRQPRRRGAGSWRCRTGRPSCGFSNAKQATAVQVGCGMLRVRRRIELLEQTFLPVVEGPPESIYVDFVDADRKVVDTLEFKMSSLPAPQS